ncbi:MAG: DUF1761 domain-containing protein [Candidatus Kerfeldbacteria bacterium]|nr:DUF1761 domain-containing protein [Candidatus Kerfeldbacteria bacterium]
MPEVTINYWAVLAATAVSMVLGSIWYSKAVFGKTWMQLVGLKEEAAKQGAAKAILGMVVGAFIQVYVLAHVVDFAQADTVKEGLQSGAWLWLGFIGAVTIADVLFAQRPFKLWLITNSYQLVIMVVNGVILATWQ